jgi:mutator protein MutT
MNITDVAVGILLRPDGRVLLAERPVGKPWAGYWEFPGGKIDTDESARQALVRELHEELGFEVERADPWVPPSGWQDCHIQPRVVLHPKMILRTEFYR